jgi:hypothetical protein
MMFGGRGGRVAGACPADDVVSRIAETTSHPDIRRGIG